MGNFAGAKLARRVRSRGLQAKGWQFFTFEIRSSSTSPNSAFVETGDMEGLKGRVSATDNLNVKTY